MRKALVLVPLDEASVTRAIDTLAEQEIEAVAVGFLHSFTNPDHERRSARRSRGGCRMWR